MMARMAEANADLLVRVLRGDESADGDPVMVALAAGRSLGVVVDDILHGLVVRARRDGRTWAEIGDVLHVTRQAALQRFGGAPLPGGITPTKAPPLPDVEARAVELLDHFFNRRWDALRGTFNRRMLDACSVELLASVRARLPGRTAEAVEMGQPEVARLGDYTLVDVPMTLRFPLAFRRGVRHRQVSGRVTFDAEGLVAGFFILPRTAVSAGGAST
jgi:hypothetical protein